MRCFLSHPCKKQMPEGFLPAIAFYYGLLMPKTIGALGLARWDCQDKLFVLAAPLVIVYPPKNVIGGAARSGLCNMVAEDQF
jgi:hypothetical protein